MIVVNTPEVVNSPQRKEQQGADKLGERREEPKTRAHGNEETVELSPECGVGVEDVKEEALQDDSAEMELLPESGVFSRRLV